LKKNDWLKEGIANLGSGLHTSSTKGLADTLGKIEFSYIPLNQIRTEDQIRENINTESEEFTAFQQSISEKGVLEPVLLSDNKDHYLLIAGHRRLKACELLELPSIPARIIGENLSVEDCLEIQLIENIQRDDIDIIEESKAYFKYYKLKSGKSDIGNFLSDMITAERSPKNLKDDISVIITEIQKISGKSIPSLKNYTSLLKLPESIQAAIKTDTISPTHGYLLAANVEHSNFQIACDKLLQNKGKITVDTLKSYFGEKPKAMPENRSISYVGIPQYLSAFTSSIEDIVNAYIEKNAGKTVEATLDGFTSRSAILRLGSETIFIKDRHQVKKLKEMSRQTDWDKKVTLHIDGTVTLLSANPSGT
jgi:ParB-like chromosome segregation protein Spo0J